jgi:hypothetical protein
MDRSLDSVEQNMDHTNCIVLAICCGFLPVKRVLVGCQDQVRRRRAESPIGQRRTSELVICKKKQSLSLFESCLLQWRHDDTNSIYRGEPQLRVDGDAGPPAGQSLDCFLRPRRERTVYLAWLPKVTVSSSSVLAIRSSPFCARVS